MITIGWQTLRPDFQNLLPKRNLAAIGSSLLFLIFIAHGNFRNQNIMNTITGNYCKKTVLAGSLAFSLASVMLAQSPLFTPGKLAVLQLGDGGSSRCLPV